MYDAVVAHYSSPAIASLGRLLLPYLFPELSAFATVEDLNPPPMYITLYFILTRLPESLRAVRDHFLALDPTALTIDLLGQHLLPAETSVVTVGAARGTPRTPFFGGCSPSPLAPSYASADAAAVQGAEDVEAASTSEKRRTSKGKGGRGGGGGSGGGNGGGGSGGSGGGSGSFGGGGGGSGGSEFSDKAERPCWAELLRSGVAIFDLDYDAILAAMYAMCVSAEGDCYLCVPPDPGIEAAALGASESALPSTAPVEALHTFTLDSGASRCFFRDSITLTPLSAPVPVRPLAAPSRPRRRPSAASSPLFCGPVAALLAAPSPPFRGPVAALQLSRRAPRGTRRAFPHLPSLQPPLTYQRRHSVAALRLSSRQPPPPLFLCSRGEEGMGVAGVGALGLRLQLRERFCTDLPVLYLHSDRGGEFSSDLLRDFCRGEGILYSFTLPDSPQQNGIAERRIGLVMEVARTSMIHAAAPHFLWPFAVRYSAHQLNFWPRVSLPEILPTLRWTGKVGSALVFQFYHPTSRRVLPSQDVTLDESIPFYRLFTYRSAPPPPPVLFLAPGPPRVAIGSGAAPGAAFGGAEPGGVESKGTGSGGAEPEVEPGGSTSGGAESRGTASSGGPVGAPSRLSPQPEPLSPQQLREWFAQHTRLRSGATGARESATGDTGAGGAGVTARASGTGGAAAATRGGARTRGTGAAGTGGVEGAGVGDATEPGAARTGGFRAVGVGAGGTSVGGAGAGGAGARADECGARGASGTVRLRPYFVPLLQQVLYVSSSTGLTPPPPPIQTGGLIECREPASRLASPARTGHRVPRPRPPPIPGTYNIILRPSSVPLRVPLPPPPESSLPTIRDPKSDRARAASPTISRLLAIIVTEPSFQSTAASTLVAELVDFATACRLDYAIALVADSESASPLSDGGEGALGTNVLEDRQEDFECLAAVVPCFASMLLALEGDPDAPDIPTPRSYVEAIMVPPSRANIVNGMWIFSMKWPPDSPPAFKARYVARGFSQRQGVDYFQTFSPTSKMTTLWALQCFGFQFSSPQPTPLSTSHSLSAPPLDESVEPSGPYPELLGCLMHQKVHKDVATRLLRYLCNTSGMWLVLGGWGPVVLTGHADASWFDDSGTQRSSQGYTFSLGSGSVSWWSIRSSSVLSSNCDAEIYAGAMAAQELRWLTYLLTDLGEQPRSPPVLYVDNKAMIDLCQEHRTKHIALRYFLAREMQHRGQICLAYVTTRANTADIFTKALPPGDHQRFSTLLGPVPTLPHLLTA
ncbi:unnamed protein product [Closterium sp. NIES-54]